MAAGGGGGGGGGKDREGWMEGRKEGDRGENNEHERRRRRIDTGGGMRELGGRGKKQNKKNWIKLNGNNNSRR